MKIIAVGMNYVAHCHELHADEKLPEEPVIFMKPDSALLKDSKPFFIPDFSQQVDYETELVAVSYTHLDVYKRQNFDEEMLKQITTGACISVNGELTESIGSGQAAEVQARGIEVLGTCLLYTSHVCFPDIRGD